MEFSPQPYTKQLLYTLTGFLLLYSKWGMRLRRPEVFKTAAAGSLSSPNLNTLHPSSTSTITLPFSPSSSSSSSPIPCHPHPDFNRQHRENRPRMFSLFLSSKFFRNTSLVCEKAKTSLSLPSPTMSLIRPGECFANKLGHGLHLIIIWPHSSVFFLTPDVRRQDYGCLVWLDLFGIT